MISSELGTQSWFGLGRAAPQNCSKTQNGLPFRAESGRILTERQRGMEMSGPALAFCAGSGRFLDALRLVGMTMFANCVTALVQSYTLDGKTYTTTNSNIVESFYCQGTNQPSNAYILFGGDSTIDSFGFNFYNPASASYSSVGQCYFGQVAETTRSSFVSFEKSSDGMGNPRVLITTPEVVFDAGFSVIEPSPNRLNNLFYEITGASFSEDIENGYYALPE